MTDHPIDERRAALSQMQRELDEFRSCLATQCGKTMVVAEALAAKRGEALTEMETIADSHLSDHDKIGAMLRLARAALTQHGAGNER